MGNKTWAAPHLGCPAPRQCLDRRASDVNDAPAPAQAQVPSREAGRRQHSCGPTWRLVSKRKLAPATARTGKLPDRETAKSGRRRPNAMRPHRSPHSSAAQPQLQHDLTITRALPGSRHYTVKTFRRGSAAVGTGPNEPPRSASQVRCEREDSQQCPQRRLLQQWPSPRTRDSRGQGAAAQSCTDHDPKDCAQVQRLGGSALHRSDRSSPPGFDTTGI